MVNIDSSELQQARQNIAQARSTIQQERDKNKAIRETLQEVSSKISSQSFIRRDGGINALRQRQQATTDISKASNQIQQREEQISQYEKDVLEPYEAQVSAQESLQRDIVIASKAASKGQSNILANERQREIYRQLREGISSGEQRLEAIKSLRQQGYEPVFSSSGELMAVEDLNNFQTINVKEFNRPLLSNTPMSSPTEQLSSIPVQRLDSGLYNVEIKNVVSPVEKSKYFFGRLQEDLLRKGSKLETETLRKGYNPITVLKTAGYGVVGGVVSLPLFAEQLVRDPLKTTGSLFLGGLEAGKRVVSGEGFPEATAALQSRPTLTTSKIVGESLPLTSIPRKLITSGIDIYRTRGLVELPAEAIVAPEYFAGQRYPAIRRGQSAGELLREFKPKEIYGVTPLRGFTASAKPFARDTLTLAGSSELPGVYQAPKVSPTFLRVAGENEFKLFGLNPLGTTRPTAMKIDPLSYELVPGVSPAQRNLASLGKAKIFFQEGVEAGKSYVPFIKTEKEAVIPAGTQLGLRNKRFYFDFEGRRVPILEFDVVSEQSKNLGTNTLKTKEISKLYSSYVPKSRSLINPSSSLATGSLLSSYFLPSRSSSYPISSSGSSSPSSSGSSSPSSSGSSSVSSLSSGSFTSSSGGGFSISQIPSLSSGSSSSTPTYPSTPYYPGYPSDPGYPDRSSSSLRSSILRSALEKVGAWDVYVKRKGKYKKIADDLPRNLAEKKGAEYTKRTLAASFKLVRDVNAKTKRKDIDYEPDPNVFRDYKISKGQRVPLKDEWIQRRGKRLSQRTEVSEIMGFKRVKGGFFI